MYSMTYHVQLVTFLLFYITKATISIREFLRLFPTDEKCLRYLFKRRKKTPCKRCKSLKFYRHPTQECFTCRCGKTHVFPRQGTIFEKSHISLRDWFYAIFLMSKSRNGVSSYELQRHLGVSLRTAWRMQRLIRSLMKEKDIQLSGTVEIDETMIGGKTHGERGRYAGNKSVVLGMIERGGRVKAVVVPDIRAHNLFPHLKSTIEPGSQVFTDQLRSYRKLTPYLGVTHKSVDHSRHEYARPDGTHTNTIENFWSQMKRSIDGTHHSVSKKHLPSYVSEYTWKHNHKTQDMCILLLELACTRNPRDTKNVHVSA